MIDLHSDTISRFLREKPEANLIDNPFSISRGRLEKGGIGAQCMALFVYNDGRINPWEKLNILHDRFLSELSLSGIPQLRDIGEYDGTLKAILTTEEGASIEGRLERLETLKEWGVLIFGLVWNFENELCYPNSRDKEIMRHGLKDTGFDAIAECERLGIAIDVSHLNDGGFWDVVKASRKPFMATHSNARAITDVPRNLTDEMIHALADKGGVMGLNLCPAFLSDIPEGTKEEDAESRIEDMVRHVEHIYKVGGEDVLAIGSDFDGIYGKLEIPSPDRFHLLFEALERRGMSLSVIDKMKEKNALRVLHETSVS